jgi:plastocyanin
MSRAALLIAILLVGSLALVTTFGGVAGARSTTIQVGDDFFSPDKKTVGKGTKVKFKWVGRDEHNVTKKSGPGSAFASATTDARGVNFSKKFKKSGTYKLICTIHDGMNMKLTVR